MTTTSAEIEARTAELKNTPAPVKRVFGLGTLVGCILLLRFCASAFAGHVTWDRAIFSGAVQLVLIWFLSFSVLDRRKWAWWGLAALIVVHMWGALGHPMRLLRVAIEGTLAAHGREIVFDAVGLAQFLTSGILLGFLLSRQVRCYVRNTDA
jgi:hypothetical protein